MTKKARQAHIPTQQIGRRKVRRINPLPSSPPVGEASFADPVSDASAGALMGGGPVETREHWNQAPRTGRRLASVQATREGTGVRTVPGQLPVFERAYLISELSRIALISTALLAVIIGLTLVLR